MNSSSEMFQDILYQCYMARAFTGKPKTICS